METRLLYVVDPMCSWCWGFAPVLAAVEPELADGVILQCVLGGLAPDSDAPMDAATRAYVQNAWRAVAERTGAAFNHDFWERCAPRRSTYPACRAMLVARRADRERDMLAEIQRAYYLEARNPSDAGTLADLAHGLGLDRDAFLADLRSPETQRALEADLALRDRLGATSFPSLGLVRGAELRLLATGWLDAAAFRGVLGNARLLR